MIVESAKKNVRLPLNFQKDWKEAVERIKSSRYDLNKIILIPEGQSK